MRESDYQEMRRFRPRNRCASCKFANLGEILQRPGSVWEGLRRDLFRHLRKWEILRAMARVKSSYGQARR